MRRARMQKTAYEIGQMKIDGLHQVAAYRRIPHIYEEDMTDVEFQVEIEACCVLKVRWAIRACRGGLWRSISEACFTGQTPMRRPYEFALGGAGTDPSLPVGADGS